MKHNFCNTLRHSLAITALCLSVVACKPVQAQSVGLPGGGQIIHFGSLCPLYGGFRPVVSLSGNTAVQVSPDTKGVLFYRVGTLNTNYTFKWGNVTPIPNSNGEFLPSISLYGNTVMEAHTSVANDISYRLGTVNTNYTITWGKSYPFGKGLTPSISLYGSTAVLFYNSVDSDTIVYNVGSLHTGGWINFPIFSAVLYGKGCTLSVSLIGNTDLPPKN